MGAVVGRLLGGSSSAATTDLDRVGCRDHDHHRWGGRRRYRSGAGQRRPGAWRRGPRLGPDHLGVVVGGALDDRQHRGGGAERHAHRLGQQGAGKGAAQFTDPTSHDVGIVIQSSKGSFVAFDATCTHQGCPVDYSKSAKRLVCPCHGAEFDASSGAVLRGPARRPLSKIAVSEGSDGNLYVT